VTTKIIAIGHKHPKWVLGACDDFLVRLPKTYQPKIETLPLAIRPQTGYDAKQALLFKKIEAETIFKKIQPDDWVVALHPNGKSYSTEAFADYISDWQQHYKNILFLIGGPDGLCDSILARANFQLSLSKLTFPHTLAKVILVEQLYRAYTLQQNHPYHR
jgi:23S rRNA (pseudouridine1915-N3)-methyltransferase